MQAANVKVQKKETAVDRSLRTLLKTTQLFDNPHVNKPQFGQLGAQSGIPSGIWRLAYG
jgi:hypothetical protein